MYLMIFQSIFPSAYGTTKFTRSPICELKMWKICIKNFRSPYEDKVENQSKQTAVVSKRVSNVSLSKFVNIVKHFIKRERVH